MTLFVTQKSPIIMNDTVGIKGGKLWCVMQEDGMRQHLLLRTRVLVCIFDDPGAMQGLSQL